MRVRYAVLASVPLCQSPLVQEDAIAEVELVIAATPARIWRALEPAGLRGWLCETASGELRVGGQLSLGWPSLGLDVELEVQAAEPGRRLIVRGTGDADGQWQDTSLIAEGDATRIVIRHGGFGRGRRAGERAAGSEAGWRVATRLLDLYLGGREGTTLSARSVVGTAAASVAALWPAIGEVDPLARWLGPVDGSLDIEGGRATLTLGRQRLAGLVLCRAAPYELALSLPSIEAVLRLRLIALGDGGPTLVCLQLLGWAGPAPLVPLEEPLARALDRLLSRSGSGAVA
jgi:uncharacterized protein YndB with AHSA1/START domain